MNILETIVAKKRQEIAQARAERPLSLLETLLADAPPALDFKAALHAVPMAIIAEVKKASPSAGIIRSDFDPIAIAQSYAAAGADCLSILTDETFFQGHLDNLRNIRPKVNIPLLRKEFILDRHQLVEARLAGADAVLLIAEILTDHELATLLQQTQEYGMQALVEIHEANNLQRVLDCGITLLGINNRDLRKFATKLEHTLDLLPRIPGHISVVSESGIRTHADMVRLRNAGVKAVLVGESLMRQADVGAGIRALHGE